LLPVSEELVFLQDAKPSTRAVTSVIERSFFIE
jgi:hypothetical protein